MSANEPLAGLDFGTQDAGTRSVPRKLFLFNNKGGSGASAATDLRYTTTDPDGGEAGDVVAQRWLEVRVRSRDGVPVTDPDGGFKPVGGSLPEHQKDLSAFPLENGSYLELEVRMAVPMAPAAGERAFVHRADYKFT